MYYASATKISSFTTIRRDRVLPEPGEVLVDPGDRVESTQVVARASIPGDFRILAVGRMLGILASEVQHSLQTELGSTVHRGDVIAKREGLLGRSVSCPIDGVVTATGGGRVLIEAKPLPFELRAHISGHVLAVENNQMITLGTAGALVQGFWGAGEESVGPLKFLTKRADEPLEARTIDASCHGRIIVAGMILDEEPLSRAEDIDAQGIVTGGLSPELLSAAKQLPFPLIVTDGFGDFPMMKGVFTLLKDHEEEEASISGQTETGHRARRPEIIIPLPNREPPVYQTQHAGEFEPGLRVRAVRAPYAGLVGTILDIPQFAQRMESGARVRCAEIDVGQDKPVVIPLVNLDVLR